MIYSIDGININISKNLELKKSYIPYNEKK